MTRLFCPILAGGEQHVFKGLMAFGAPKNCGYFAILQDDEEIEEGTELSQEPSTQEKPKPEILNQENQKENLGIEGRPFQHPHRHRSFKKAATKPVNEGDKPFQYVGKAKPKPKSETLKPIHNGKPATKLTENGKLLQKSAKESPKQAHKAEVGTTKKPNSEHKKPFKNNGSATKPKTEFKKPFFPRLDKYGPIKLFFDDEDVEDYSLEENLEYLKTEFNTGYPCYRSWMKRKQISDIIESTPDKGELVRLLSNLPENEFTMKMKVVNDSQLPVALIVKVLRLIFVAKIEDCRKKFFQLHQRLSQSQIELDYLEESAEDSFGDLIDSYISGIQKSHSCDLPMLSQAISAIACAAVSNVRIIDNMAHFSGIKQPWRLEAV